jgi:membrane-associated protein
MTDLLSGIPDSLVLAVMAVILLAESGLLVGVFLPGATLVLAVGFLVRHGVVDVGPAIVTGAVASALGCQVGYLRGRGPDRWLGRQVAARLGQDRVRRVLSSLDRRAELTIAVCQCFGVVRTLVPRLAGRAGVSRMRFAVFNVPMAFAWASALVLLGYLSGSAYEQVRALVGLAGLPVVASVLIIAWIVRRLRRARPADIQH